MKKLDIVNNITRKSQIKKNNVSQVVELFLSEIKSALYFSLNISSGIFNSPGFIYSSSSFLDYK